jgi:mannitol-specific phosphotransferase system IIBC component
MDDKLKFLLKSRKFWAVIMAVLIVAGFAFMPNFPLTSEQVSYLVYVLIAYIIGTALEDQGRGQVIPSPALPDPADQGEGQGEDG